MSETDTQVVGSRETLHTVAYRGTPPNEYPVVELNGGEWIYPITTVDGRFKLNVHLLPYTSYAVKKFYDQILPRRKARTAQQNVIDSDFAAVRTFIDEHFMGLSGVALEDGSQPSPEQQRTWIDQNSDFKIRAFREGVDKVGPRVEVESAAPGRAILIMGRPESLIETDIELFSRARNREERIRVNHAVARLTESDRHQYDRAIKFIEDTRQRETFLEANWDVIENLYGQRIKSLTGAVVNGEPCTEGNKDAWVKLVPFCWKIYVMSAVYQEIELKNG